MSLWVWMFYHECRRYILWMSWCKMMSMYFMGSQYENIILKIALNEFLHKMIAIVLSCYGNMIFFLCQALIILGSFLFDKVVLMRIGFWFCQWELSFDVANENWALMLLIRIGLWCCQWELGFEWIAIGLNHGLRLWIWIPLIKFVLPWTWIMGFSNIGKHKYSWVLNIIRCVYLKVDRWYLNKIRCDKKKYPNSF